MSSFNIFCEVANEYKTITQTNEPSICHILYKQIARKTNNDMLDSILNMVSHIDDVHVQSNLLCSVYDDRVDKMIPINVFKNELLYLKLDMLLISARSLYKEVNKSYIEKYQLQCQIEKLRKEIEVLHSVVYHS